jgi:hypothetical protein
MDISLQVVQDGFDGRLTKTAYYHVKIRGFAKEANYIHLWSWEYDCYGNEALCATWHEEDR